jgi:hypothetical protein
LKEWSRTEELYMTCTNKEKGNSRNWGAYGLSEEDSKTVCSVEDLIQINGGRCRDDCSWEPSRSNIFLTCTNRRFDEPDDAEKNLDKKDSDWNTWYNCDCPCRSLVEIVKPRFLLRGLDFCFLKC